MTLIELMIGIAIGLLVSLAALGTMAFTRVSSITVSDTVRLQQDASVAMRMIGQQIRQARAIALQNTIVDAGVGSVGYANFTGLTPPGAPGETAVYGVNGGLVDSLTVSFSLSPGIQATHCMGFATVAPGTNTVASSFDVAAGSLRCMASDGTGNFNAVIDNVEDLQVWYGVRNGLNNNIQYLDATQVGALNWPSVGSVMVCLRLVGTSRNAPQPPPGFVFRGCQNEAVAWDGRFRRVFRQIFTLRNPA